MYNIIDYLVKSTFFIKNFYFLQEKQLKILNKKQWKSKYIQ